MHMHMIVQSHEKKAGPRDGTWPRLKCTFYEQNLVLQNQVFFPGLWRAKQTLEQPHEKNGSFLLQNVALTALGTHAAECGPDPFGHTRALEGPFFDPRLSSVSFRVREYNMSYYIASTGV